MRGTIQLNTKRLRLRKHQPTDGHQLHMQFGMDAAMYAYSGWNPYETETQAEETIHRMIAQYSDASFYSWAVEYDGEMVGIVGAYDYDAQENSIEVGISIFRQYWGQGFATESLHRVLKYLTQEEGIRLVKAWCAVDHIASRKAMEQSGMVAAGVEKASLLIGDAVFDKLHYIYPSP